MPEKIYDIKPPKLVQKVEEGIKEFLGEKNKKKNKRGRNKREKRPIWLPISIGAGALLLLIGVYLFFKLPKADVKIWPKVETLSFQQTITADTSAILTDIAESVIPAQRFEIFKTLSEDFPATGNVSDEGRASGTITIYNKYDPPQSVTFRPGTHFLSDSGKLFRASDRVVIPRAQKSGGKITPGSVQVKVRAVEGGDSYNIPASNFSVPGLKGTAFYYSVYASSDSPMSGGYTGDIKKVTDSDIQSAKDVLIKKLTSRAAADLEKQISSDYALLDKAVSSEITGAGAQTESGTVTDKFAYEATVKLLALAFKKSNLDEFAKKYIISQMPDGKTLLDSSLKVDYSVASVDISGGTMTLDLSFSSGIYKSVDKNSMSLSLAGKNASQISQTISGALGEEFSKAEINFWPFWVSSAPKNQKAVNVKLMFEPR